MAITQADVDELDAAILKLAKGTVQHVQLRDGRAFRHYDLPQLQAIRDTFKNELAAITQAASGDGGMAFATFGRPR